MATKKNQSPGKKEVSLRLSIEETNTILRALGHLPFMEVYKLIEKIHLQATEDAPGSTKK